MDTKQVIKEIENLGFHNRTDFHERTKAKSKTISRNRCWTKTEDAIELEVELYENLRDKKNDGWKISVSCYNNNVLDIIKNLIKL